MDRVLIGGVGYRWQRDASFGLVASDALAALEWPASVEVMDLGYGALFVAQDIAAAKPSYDRLILLAGLERGRQPGRLYRSRWMPTTITPEEMQARIREAGAGVVHLDHLLAIAQHFDALPRDVLLFEVEPFDARGGEELSSPVAALLPDVLDEVRRAALGEAASEEHGECERPETPFVPGASGCP